MEYTKKEKLMAKEYSCRYLEKECILPKGFIYILVMGYLGATQTHKATHLGSTFQEH